ncbi:helix-turn-helix domain-containing protein [Mesonia aquimarina]|uniref:helix-turn-helix domain-containing protein n=1 Tax=Mesonia aquimarina TaxID=1504967 RepID=UPI000EF60C18|nr:AraC family transcriptional regulator [Mesonia aquimarina]
MKIRFESSACKEEVLVKEFNKDFETSVLLEKEYSGFKESVMGTVKEIHLNNLFVLLQNNKNSENHTLYVSQNQPVFLLQFVIDGQVTIASKGNIYTEFVLNKNMYNLFYIPASGSAQTYFSDEKHILNIYFTEFFIEDKIGEFFIKKMKNYQQAKKGNQFFSFFNKGLVLNRKLRDIINDLLNCSFDGIVKQSYLEVKLTELLIITLASNYSASAANKLKEADRENLLQIESYIKTHLKEELSIEKLSMLAGFNTSKFKSYFKQVYGMPVFKYITSLRIEKAIQLILKHDYTISQASFEVGYKNPQHFTVAFKKKLGYLPSQLTKRSDLI